VNCELADRLIDDFMHDELNQRDRTWMEEHLASCPRCAMQLRKYPALEREMRRALAASVRPLYLSADASARILEASEESLSRAGRAYRTALTVRLASGALALLLVAVGVLALLGRIPLSSNLKPVSLLPAKSLPSVEPELEAAFDADKPLPAMAAPMLSQLEASLLIEPRDLHSHEPFTMTVYVQSNMPEPKETMGLDLDVSGPTGDFHFELSLQDPLPAEGMSIFRVTPDLLANSCEERYLMSPTDMFATPGTYTIRMTLMNPVVASE
jgi:hypothetical protein